MKIFIYYCLCLCLCLSTTSAGTIDPEVPESKYIEYAKQYEYVLPIVGIYSDKENNFFRASCVLIDENFILTAAHVVTNSAIRYVIYNNELYECKIINIHKNFKMNEIGFYDIAIGKLEKKIKLNNYPKLYNEKNEIGKTCSIAGYGYGGNFLTGSVSKHDNMRRAGLNIIDEIDKHLLICSAHTKPKTQLEILTSSGDSGGGLFIGSYLAGISSIVIATDGKSDSNYGDFCGFTRISEYYDWINKEKEDIIRIIDNEK